MIMFSMSRISHSSTRFGGLVSVGKVGRTFNNLSIGQGEIIIRLVVAVAKQTAYLS